MSDNALPALSNDEKRVLLWITEQYERTGDSCIYVESLSKEFEGLPWGSLPTVLNRFNSVGFIKFETRAYFVVQSLAVELSNAIRNPPPRDLRKETETKFNAGPFAPYHYYAKELLPYFAAGVSVLSLCVAFAAFWTRPDKPSAVARPDESATPAATAPELPSVEPDTPANLGAN